MIMYFVRRRKKIVIISALIRLCNSTMLGEVHDQSHPAVTSVITKDLLGSLTNDGIKRYIQSLPTDQDVDLIERPVKLLGITEIVPAKNANLGSELDRYLYLATTLDKDHKLPAPSSITSDFFFDKMNIINNPEGKSLLQQITEHNPSLTAAGKLNFVALLTSATLDVTVLKQRQDFIAFLVKHPQFCAKIKKMALQIKQAEPHITNFFAPTQELNAIDSLNYILSFENIIGLARLNKSSLALSASSVGVHPFIITSLIVGGIAGTIPFIVNFHKQIKRALVSRITRQQTVALLKSASGTAYTVAQKAPGFIGDLIRETPQISLDALAAFIDTSVRQTASLASLAKANPELILSLTVFAVYFWFMSKLLTNSTRSYISRMAQKFSHLIIALKNSYQALIPITQELAPIMSLDSFKVFIDTQKQSAELGRVTRAAARKSIQEGVNAPLFGKGGPISFINNLLETRSELAAALWDFGTIEMYVTLADLYRTQQKSKTPYCFADYVTADKPYIAMEDFWNPFIDPRQAVTNSLVIGGTEPANIIVTGPNTGGKTTILKSLSYNALLAQTCGIAAARKCVLTPFSKILCQINVTDDLAHGLSLFTAEVRHAKLIKTEIKQLKPGEFCFVVMDEAFRGTLASEGEQISLDFAEHLATYPNVLTITATHYHKLGLLEKFGQWHVEVILHEGKKGYTRTFKLKRGLSTVTIARDILEEEKILE